MNDPQSPQATDRDSGLEVVTMGCRLNAYESEVMRRNAAAAETTNTVIVNTCAVTAEAVRQARQTIRRVRRERPEATIVATGCAAQIDPDAFASMKEVTRVVGNAEKLRPETFSSSGQSTAAPRVEVGDIMAERSAHAPSVDGIEGRARAFVQVQTGCDHRCTFCIIPFGRGNSRSVPPEEVIAQSRRLVETGHYEIVLTGVDLTSWAFGELRLGDLVAMLLDAIPDLPQLRLSSIDAIEIDHRLFGLITTNDRIAPYLHLSFQSGDDLILKRMMRRHSRMQAVELVRRLKQRRPEISIGADLIAGFPTETEEMHRNNVSILQECAIVHAHIFPFSPRPGTPAARMPQVDPAIVRARAREMREAAASVRSEWLARMVGTRHRVLVENDGTGHSENFARFRVPQDARPGTIVALTALSIQDGLVIGNYA